jgi:hypothetical protein
MIGPLAHLSRALGRIEIELAYAISLMPAVPESASPAFRRATSSIRKIPPPLRAKRA